MNALTDGLMFLAADITSSADTAADNAVSDIDFGSVLVSFFYFLGALLLIYLVLVLVNKWGKKNQKQDNDNSEQEDKVSEEQADKDNKENRDCTGENDG